MRGPDHYLAGEEWTRHAEALYRSGHEEDAGAGQLAAAIATAHFTAATAAATAELNACAGPAGDSTMGRTVEAAQQWQGVLVDDLDPELVCTAGARRASR